MTGVRVSRAAATIGAAFAAAATLGCTESSSWSARDALATLEWPVYVAEFAAGPAGWQTVQTLLPVGQVPPDALECWTSWLELQACIVPAPVRAGALFLQSPWWLDENHAPPGGAGHLSLVAWVYVRDIESRAPPAQLDLRGARLKAQMRAAQLDLKEGQMVFWFQTSMPGGRFANFAYTGVPLHLQLLEPDEFNVIDIELTADPALWTCLGAHESRVDTYGCMPLEEALGCVDIAFGMIVFPVGASPQPELQPSGTIELGSFELWRRGIPEQAG